MDPWKDIYFDNLGLIVQRDGDGGDTAQRTGWAFFGLWYVTQHLGRAAPFDPPISFAAAADLLEVGRTGEFRRHPTQEGWKSDPDRFSRDQLIPLIAACGALGDQARVRRSRDALRTCYLVAECVQGTTDIAGPDLLNHYRRALGETTQPGGDTHLLASTLSRLAQTSGAPEDVGDDLNGLIYLAMARRFAPTSLTDDALVAFMNQRAVSAGCFLTWYRQSYLDDFGADEPTMLARIRAGRDDGWIPDCHPVLGAIRWYFRVESGGCPGLAELYAPVIDDLGLEATQMLTGSHH